MKKNAIFWLFLVFPGSIHRSFLFVSLNNMSAAVDEKNSQEYPAVLTSLSATDPVLRVIKENENENYYKVRL